ncbi:MAG: nitronate monooxygenase [Bacillota bacterium]|nr:nitronate monooxygenase [Bacillota bacterium]
MLTTRVTQLLGIRYPIIQAGMAGGTTTPELVAAVSEAGGLGTLGAGYMSPDRMREAIRAIRKRTDRPFAVNLFIPEPFEEDRDRIEKAQRRLDRFRREMCLPASPDPGKYRESFEEQISVVLEERVPVFSFTFGVLPSEWVERLKGQGTVLIGTATTVEEGAILEASGVDMVVAQGSEAGGHRGTFTGSAAKGMVGLMSLVPQMVDRIRIPVIAAGGIMDGRGLAASLMLGAEGVQMGTAFLTCRESGANSVYRDAVRKGRDDGTVLTRSFSGKYARGLRNRFVSEMEKYEEEWPDYPVQNALTRDIRREAARRGNPDLMSLWAGQSASLSRSLPAGELVRNVVREAQDLLQGKR